MSSIVILEATTFDSPTSKSHGFRMYDDYEKTYDNNSDKPIKGDMELLEYAIGVQDASVKSMIDFLSENQLGITINGTWYDYEEIKTYYP